MQVVYKMEGMLQREVSRHIQARSAPRVILFNSLINNCFGKKECRGNLFVTQSCKKSTVSESEDKLESVNLPWGKD